MKQIIAAQLLCLLTAWAALGQDPVDFQRTEDVIYGRKPGVALTLDVFQPAQPNHYGVVWVVSGGWFSSHEAINAKAILPYLKRGYTVFAVVHGSQPKYQIPEIVQDMHRSIRFIRSQAGRFGINPDKIGVTGGSAGGHLSLMLATQGGPGNPKAKDIVDSNSSAVQAVGCFFPPTDFLNYGEPGKDGVGFGVLKGFKAAFGPRSDTEEGRKALGREISPINFITSNTPPILIFHGDADELVPIQQAEVFLKRAAEVGVKTQLVRKPGQTHGWKDMERDVEVIADWFDLHLRGLKK